MGVQIQGDTGNVIATKGTFSGDVGIAGTLTYEDVTNIDSVGLVTARTGIEIGARPGVAASISVDGNMIVSGISTFGGTANFAAISGTTGTFSADTSLSIADKIVHTGDTNTALRFPGADTITAQTGGSERLRIDSNGLIANNARVPSSYGSPNLLISGTDSTLTLMGDGSTNSSSFTGIKFRVAGSSSGDYTKAGIFAQRQGGYNDLALIFALDTAADATSVAISDEKVRIDSSGRLLLGTTTEGVSTGDTFTIATSSNTGMTLRSGTSNEGNIFFSDGTSGADEYRGSIQYNHGSNFLTIGTDGSERLRIDSSGNVMIGATSASGILHVEHSGENNTYIVGNTTTSGARLILQNKNTTANSYTGVLGADAGGQTTAQILFYSADNDNNEGYLTLGTRPSGGTPTERMRITSGGRLLIGRTSNSGYDNLLQTKSITVETDGDTTGMHFNRTDSNAAWVAMRFYAQDSQSGYIQINSSSTQYSTSSDYRLKENVVSISDGITRLKQLKPYKFNFKNDPSVTVDGFFAHEVTAVPEAVSGEKDAVDEDGNPDYQVIDHSKLVPLLTAALKEAIVEIESLKSRLDTAGL